MYVVSLVGSNTGNKLFNFNPVDVAIKDSLGYDPWRRGTIEELYSHTLPSGIMIAIRAITR